MDAIKFIHLSDIHIGFETYGKINTVTGRNTRLEDVLNSLDFIFDTAIKESVELVLISGDVFHRENPHPTEETEFAKRIARLVRERDTNVVIVLGNHDYPTSFGKAAAVEIFPALNLDKVLIARKPDVHTVKLKNKVIQIACLPWARKSTLLSKDEYKSLSPEEVRVEIENKLIHIVRNLITRIDKSLPAVFVGHVALREAEFSGTEMGSLFSSDPSIPKAELLQPVLNYVALGHIHKFQNLNQGHTPPIVYSGSIERIDFSEEKEKKGFVIGEIFKGPRGGWECKFEFRETPARKFLTIELSERDKDIETIIKNIGQEDIKDSVIKIKYRVSRLNQKLDEKRIRDILSDAYMIKIEKIVEDTEKRIRSQISKTMDIMEALEKYIGTKPGIKHIAEDMKKYARKLIEELENQA